MKKTPNTPQKTPHGQALSAASVSALARATQELAGKVLTRFSFCVVGQGGANHTVNHGWVHVTGAIPYSEKLLVGRRDCCKQEKRNKLDTRDLFPGKVYINSNPRVCMICLKINSQYTLSPQLFRKLRRKDVASLMTDVCAAFSSKLAAGEYDHLRPEVSDAWSSLHVNQKQAVFDVDSLELGRAAGNCRARLVYVFPKYCLRHALRRKQDMTAALQLGVGQAGPSCCASPVTDGLGLPKKIQFSLGR